MINAIPVFGWLLSLAFNVSMAVPFWICWTVFGIGRTYFSFLPEPWQVIPFWSCVGLFISVSIIKTVFIPKLVDVSNSTDKKDD